MRNIGEVVGAATLCGATASALWLMAYGLVEPANYLGLAQ